MNLMYENLQVTDGVYGIFSKIDVGNRIIRLGHQSNNSPTSKEEIVDTLKEIISSLEK
jgi:hypothetical protein